MKCLLTCCGLVALLSTAALAEHRAALLIGNSNYPKAALASPPRDIRAVGEALKKRGFAVTQAENLNAKELKDAVAAFARSVPTRGTALISFSGYVLPNSKPDAPLADNALLPIDGNALHDGTVASSHTGAARLMTGLAKDSGSVRNILIVDGCYAHPAQQKTAKKGLIKSGKLAPESLVIFAAPTGEVLEPAMEGISPLAKKFSDALNSAQPFDKILNELSATKESALDDLSALAAPASKAIASPAELPLGAKPGDEWVSDRGMVFCWCPPGKFTIGSAENSPAHEEDEIQADIEFPQGFWIGKFEFTRREMMAIRGGVYLSTGDHKLHPLNMLHGAKDVDDYLAKLNETAPPGWSYDVPTEAEWEYAARAGTSTDYFFGNDPAELAKYGNFADRTLRESDAFGELPKNWTAKKPGVVYFGDRQAGIDSYAHKTWSDGNATMALVGSYPPNPWGLHDVHGNLAEWTSTQYHSARLVPEKPDPNVGVVTKGGSWLSTAAYCRSAMRTWAVIPENGVGLRFVLRRKAVTAPAPVAQKWTALVPMAFQSEAGATATISADGVVLVSGKPAKDTYTLHATVPAGIEPKAIKLEALADPSLPKQGPGRAGDGQFLLCEFGVRFGTPGSKDATKSLRILDAQADFVQPGTRITDVIDGRSDPNTGWGISGATGKDHAAVFPIALPSRNGPDGARWRHPRSANDGPVAGSPLVFVLDHSNAATLGKFRLSLMHEVPDVTTAAQKPRSK
ncbi:MAG: SUMF1/EgtB/PvdO family nonheme iron enzyme [Limisphaerales bacterium]